MVNDNRALAVQRGAAVVVSYEGDALGPRLLALREAGRDLSNLFIISARDPLSPCIDVRTAAESPSRGELDLAAALAALADALPADLPLRLILIDTLRASLAGSEDSSENVSAYLRAVRRLLAPFPDAGAIVIHHSGWQDQRARSRPARERGSSALRGNVDATYVLEADGGADAGEQKLLLRCLKLRDRERPAPLHLVRRTVVLATGSTSCLVEADPRSAASRAQSLDAAADAQRDGFDLAVLRAVAAHAPTSREKIRNLVGSCRAEAYAAVARLLDRGLLAQPARQRDPFTVSAAGAARLREAS
jgi:hypothetical protein